MSANASGARYSLIPRRPTATPLPGGNLYYPDLDALLPRGISRATGACHGHLPDAPPYTRRNSDPRPGGIRAGRHDRSRVGHPLTGRLHVDGIGLRPSGIPPGVALRSAARSTDPYRARRATVAVRPHRVPERHTPQALPVIP